MNNDKAPYRVSTYFIGLQKIFIFLNFTPQFLPLICPGSQRNGNGFAHKASNGLMTGHSCWPI
jgi:hypothetical protein